MWYYKNDTDMVLQLKKTDRDDRIVTVPPLIMQQQPVSYPSKNAQAAQLSGLEDIFY